MKRPQVIRMKSPQMARDRAVRSAGLTYASDALRGMEAALPPHNEALRIEALRGLIRLASKRVNDPLRATGILGGAASDLVPVWTDGKTSRDEAEAVFMAVKP